MLSGVTHPHTQSVHHLYRENHGVLDCVAAVHSSCVQVYACVINFVWICFMVCLCTCTVCINILSVSLSILTHTMCLCTKCLFYVCIKRVCVCVLNACSVYMLCVYFKLPIWCCYVVLLSQLSNSSNKPVVCCLIHTYTHIHRYVHTGA